MNTRMFKKMGQICVMGDPGNHATGRFFQPDRAHMHRELTRKGMTLMWLWHEYQAGNAQGRTSRYSQ